MTAHDVTTFCGFPDCPVQGVHYHNGQQKPAGDYVDLPQRVVVTLQQQQAMIERLTRERAQAIDRLLPLGEESDRLRAALVRSVSVIQTWHNMGVPEKQRSDLWDIYWRNAPELKQIREALRGDTP